MNVEGFGQDIAREPAVLRALADAHAPSPVLSEANRARIDRVLVCGLGSSRFAGRWFAQLLRSRGIDAAAEYASTERPQPAAAGTLAVVISASGKTPEALAALARHRGTSLTLAITNVPERPLAAGADLTVPLGAGKEAGGVACVSFAATLAALRLIAGELAGEREAALADVRAAADAIERIHAEAPGWLPRAAALLGREPVQVIAPDARIASALQGALMLREGPRIRAAASEAGDWLHVDLYLSRHPGYRAILFSGGPYDTEILRWLRERSATVVGIGDAASGADLSIPGHADGNPIVAALSETTVLELIAAELWRTTGEGSPPDALTGAYAAAPTNRQV